MLKNLWKALSSLAVDHILNCMNNVTLKLIKKYIKWNPFNVILVNIIIHITTSVLGGPVLFYTFTNKIAGKIKMR